jgi:hypothetical protein
VIEYMPSIQEALGSIPSTEEKVKVKEGIPMTKAILGTIFSLHNYSTTLSQMHDS